jgi:outer membrane protein assembly factor BamD
LEREAYVGAVARAKFLLENYPQSQYTGDALAVMAESYNQLGQDSLEADTRRVLEQNFPQHAYFHGGWPKRQAKWKKLIPFMGEDRG